MHVIVTSQEPNVSLHFGADGSGGVVLARFDSVDEAERYARSNALVVDGYHTVEVRSWTWAHRGNGYLDAVAHPRPVRRSFVPLPLDKNNWHPSPLPGQIVLVTTTAADGELHVAAKSWVSMAAFAGPIVGFGCNVEHRTSRNIEATGEFVINVADSTLAPLIWAMTPLHGLERVERSGLTFVPARTVGPQVVADCVAHLECRHHRTVAFEGGEIFIFGTVVAADIDERCVSGAPTINYHRLDPVFFLEDQLYASLARPTRP
ncbi:MAG: flavin reductase [Acidimicrobiia bacterium]